MILAVIQARMSSTRLSGKVLRKVMDKPILGYLLERLGYSKRIDKILVASSVDKSNDELCAYVKNAGFDVYRGSENDVLARYYDASRTCSAKDIVRITADCPLIDPCICDRLIDFYISQKADYACLDQMFAEGLDCEIFSFKALEIAYKETKLKSDREHVTRYFHNHPELFKKVILKNSGDDSGYRVTVDEPEDFEVVRSIIEALYKKSSQPFSFDEVRKFLDTHKSIMKMNAHIIRNEGLLKSLKDDELIK